MQKKYLRKIEWARDCPALPEPGVLYLCDDPKQARRLQEAGCPVLAYFHEGNQGADFGGVKYGCENPKELEEEYFERIYRRLMKIPWDILETKRCLIRETVERDVEDFYELYAQPQITRYMEDLYPEPEQEKQYVREYIEKVYAFYEFGVWTVLEKETEAVIGRAGFYYREGFENPELGFVIGVPWQGKGIALEVCRACLQYGRDVLGFERVNAMVHPQNTVSKRLCERLGFAEAEELVLEDKPYVRMEKVLILVKE